MKEAKDGQRTTERREMRLPADTVNHILIYAEKQLRSGGMNILRRYGNMVKEELAEK